MTDFTHGLKTTKISLRNFTRLKFFEKSKYGI